ncbi:MAG: penicillin-binding protein 2 [Muribaculaceae bacterium]|nr:penicillin-binding protein 2 [Muribaculaceae bacterium]
MRKDYNLEKRKFVIGGFIVAIIAIYLWKLYDLQVTSNEYSQIAVSNARSVKITHPSRGQIYDRNGNLVVYNEPAYDLVLTPKDVTEFDTTTMCKILQLKREDFDLLWKNMSDPKKNRNYSAVTPQPLVQNLDSLTYGRLQEILYRFPGFDIAQRVIRRYNYVSAANILGDIREVNADDIARDSDKYYLPGDYTGDLGVEKSYEKYLRGTKGKEILVRDARGRIKGRYNDGKDDVAPVAGKDLQLSIDMDLQQFGEKIMRGKKGAIVAIEPKTGEVLALVTSPCYDPALLVGKDRGKNYTDLVNDPNKPLFDRSIMAAYPPGSTFKPSQGLMFLQEGIVNTSTSYPCSHGYINRGLKIGCHGHGSPIALHPAIATSCNGYFCWGLYYMLNNKKYGGLENSFTLWKDYMVSMGFGYKLNIDLPSESRGFIPNAQFYNKMIGEGKWGANTILSIAIGQGEVMLTPLQIANLGATIANRGYFITPHVVKNIRDVGILEQYTVQHHTKVNSEYYNEIVTGMRMAVTGGTCRGANLPGLDVCGKTGTVQNPHGQDHSVFMGFAPKDDPKIAICVYVENAGFGAKVAVPLGAMVMERYLRGYSDEIEERANKWSGDSWMEQTQNKPSEATQAQQPTTTASNTPQRNNKPLDNNPESEKAIVVNPIRFISTSRHGLYKG